MKIWSKTRFATEQRSCHPYLIKILPIGLSNLIFCQKVLWKCHGQKGKINSYYNANPHWSLSRVRKSKRIYSENLATFTWPFLALRNLGSVALCLVGFHLSASLSLSLTCQQRDRDNTSEQTVPLAARCIKVKSTEFNTHLSVFLLLFMEWGSWVCKCPLAGQVWLEDKQKIPAGLLFQHNWPSKNRDSHHMEHYKSDWGMCHLDKAALGTACLSVFSFFAVTNQMQTSTLVSE